MGFNAPGCHADLLQKKGIIMNASLDSHVNLGSMDSYSPASQGSSPLSHQASCLLQEISMKYPGLAYIFLDAWDCFFKKKIIVIGFF